MLYILVLPIHVQFGEKAIVMFLLVFITYFSQFLLFRTYYAALYTRYKTLKVFNQSSKL